MKKKVDKKKTVQESTPDIYPVEHIAVGLIDPSPANKRRFADNDKSLLELGDSIQSQGLLQAIVVRKSPTEKKRYEMVAGERRWRAFCLKKWEKIPAVIRELTDNEAHDITASENLQREDLSPIEEAESIQVLLNDGRDAKEIADRIGKPLSWVVRRARIAKLSEKWLKAIEDPSHPLSKWSATHLELIARYDHTKQDELFDEEYGDEWNTEYALLTVKELEKSLNERMLILSGAPWKTGDETLLPSAGACTQCQKRTSCEPSLFEPIEDTKGGKSDRCLDRDCWSKKLVAYHEIRIKKKREENSNLILIDKSNHSNNGSLLPGDHPWKKLLSEGYKYESAKKSDKKAVPAYIVDGPGAGRIEYMKLQSWCEKSEKTRPIGNDGKPAPKTLEERRADLEKRRVIRFINKLMMILRGEDPDATGAKSGVCRVCGCTEGNCTQCVEKTGSPCHWINQEKTLCSACMDGEHINDQRESIAFTLSHIEVHALVAAFGAAEAELDEENDDEYALHEFDRWKVYHEVVQMNGVDAIRSAVYGVFDRIVDQLRQLTYSSDPEVEFPNNLCAALKLDRETIWTKVIEEIPEPKSWAKLDTDGKPKTSASKKKTRKTEKQEEVGSSEELPATRYNYRGHEIFVSAGLGGKEFGTFRVSNGGSGLKRIVSKKMPMVSDKNEAQRNLDKFAKDKSLSATLTVTR